MLIALLALPILLRFALETTPNGVETDPLASIAARTVAIGTSMKLFLAKQCYW